MQSTKSTPYSIYDPVHVYRRTENPERHGVSKRSVYITVRGFLNVKGRLYTVQAPGWVRAEHDAKRPLSLYERCCFFVLKPPLPVESNVRQHSCMTAHVKTFRLQGQKPTTQACTGWLWI